MQNKKKIRVMLSIKTKKKKQEDKSSVREHLLSFNYKNNRIIKNNLFDWD